MIDEELRQEIDRMRYQILVHRRSCDDEVKKWATLSKDKNSPYQAHARYLHLNYLFLLNRIPASYFNNHWQHFLKGWSSIPIYLNTLARKKNNLKKRLQALKYLRFFVTPHEARPQVFKAEEMLFTSPETHHMPTVMFRILIEEIRKITVYQPMGKLRVALEELRNEQQLIFGRLGKMSEAEFRKMKETLPGERDCDCPPPSPFTFLEFPYDEEGE